MAVQSVAVGIIIPTRDNKRFLEPCIRSIRANTTGLEYHIYVANNGSPGGCDWAKSQETTVLEHASGQGWVDGLIAGGRVSTEPYLLLLNDDTLIVPNEPWWLWRLRRHFTDARVGAVGPGTNCANSMQSAWQQGIPPVYVASRLIGFCVLVSRTALEAAGGFDVGMQSADDLDLSYRLRRAKYLLIGDRTVFVYHAGFVTGSRIHGNHMQAGGYNSWEWAARDSELLTRKHGPTVHDYLAESVSPPAYEPDGD